MNWTEHVTHTTLRICTYIHDNCNVQHARTYLEKWVVPQHTAVRCNTFQTDAKTTVLWFIQMMANCQWFGFGWIFVVQTNSILVESSLQRMSSNSSLWKRTNWPVIYPREGYCGISVARGHGKYTNFERAWVEPVACGKRGRRTWRKRKEDAEASAPTYTLSAHLLPENLDPTRRQFSCRTVSGRESWEDLEETCVLPWLDSIEDFWVIPDSETVFVNRHGAMNSPKHFRFPPCFHPSPPPLQWHYYHWLVPGPNPLAHPGLGVQDAAHTGSDGNSNVILTRQSCGLIWAGL